VTKDGANEGLYVYPERKMVKWLDLKGGLGGKRVVAARISEDATALGFYFPTDPEFKKTRYKVRDTQHRKLFIHVPVSHFNEGGDQYELVKDSSVPENHGKTTAYHYEADDMWVIHLPPNLRLIVKASIRKIK
jgi:hypothetical protein